ncbi:single-stranded-DNA-specific exonuclease RecJ [Halalkalibacillus sediminis]|uniref:Single-stranded-DNA-specific exonuclease RecJ n=1 Tax=Halalkalibacillus sediminis TaxID=2018042 RepID=A0A2I0QXM8_9BACI|nr:single-stranded-DNA-specific exonuclease RecJ [Halalkalibacillus sediminis]PKR79093.1 single-stranded-DNA-specific exonuclease RecJ [Halalkalibacillus sediminis]
MLESKMNWKIQTEDIHHSLDLNISPVLKRMLAKRGIVTVDQAKAFLRPSLNDLHDPFLFDDMEKVVERIRQAIDQQQPILVYGDYDADGVTSTSVIVRTLKLLGAEVDFYIPNRFTEGYGPNEAAFQEAHAMGFEVIITVDNGIAAPHEARVAKELGIDLIITDHHEEQDELPDAFATIHPRLAPDYPFNDLAGVGVALKVAEALLGELPKELLEYAAIGTVADLVPLQGENRVLVYYGLKELTNSKLPGIQALKQIARISEDVTEETIGFVMGPRLNAVGRLQDASLAVELLLEEDPEVAIEMAGEIDRLNQERQKIVASIADEAILEVEEKFKGDRVLIVAKEGWNPGVLGIVASRLVNTYDRPAIVLGIDPETHTAKGSARSIPAFDLFKNGMTVRDYFIHFGGHSQAAGMTLSLDQLDPLRKALNEKAFNDLTEEDFQTPLEIEDELNLEEIDMALPEELSQLSPFGMNNPKPVFKFNGIQLSQMRKIGAKQNHIKLLGQKDGRSIDMIGFQLGQLADHLTLNSTVDVAGEIEINEWNGTKKLQIKLKDLQCLEWQLFDYRGSKNLQRIHESIPTNETVAIYFNDAIRADETKLKTLNINDPQLDEQLETANRIALLDLPDHLDVFEQVLGKSRFHSIYLCYPTNQGHFFSSVPTRDQFKQLYGILKKHQTIQEEQKLQLAQAKGWNQSQLDFMINVFFDLNFVKIVNGKIVFQEDVQPRPLTESNTYQQKIRSIQVEEKLLYASYNEMKEWFEHRMNAHSREGAVVHGL